MAGLRPRERGLVTVELAVGIVTTVLLAGVLISLSMLGVATLLGHEPRCVRIYGTGMQARHHPFDIAVHHRSRPAEGDGRDRTGRISADAGEFQESFFVLRKPSVVTRHDCFGAGVQVAGA